MDQEQFRGVEQIFFAAVDLDPAERDAFLERACAGDAALRREVEALLEASARSDEYFDKLPERIGIADLMTGGVGGRADSPRTVGEAGQQYGQYTLTEPVGSGGMGTVWRAARSDGRFEGQVAVKLLAQSAGGAAPERFALEGRYLAKLTHPNIARLLDAGVGPGRQPYLVLEYVPGSPIDQYCSDHTLTVDSRVHLFLQVLDAVTHAHAHLIVHRDIKPSNVQVTAEGSVKLLDFGVAKLLGDEALQGGAALTRQLGAALTPEYAAPEQLNGETITTATDVYSLGLLLWFLLTGVNSRDTTKLKSLAELRALAQQEPTRLYDAVTGSPSAQQLSKLARERNTSSSEFLKALRSDLDNIVRKALAVDPDERYETVADFAQDLRRYLRHEPVTAQAPTIRYRAQKFVRRHRGGVVTACITAFALVAATAITVWQMVDARQQRDLAHYQQQWLQASNEFYSLLLDEVGSAGEPLTPVQLLDRGVAMLERQYGATDRFVGRLLYDVSRRYANLGETATELKLLAQAESIARRQQDPDLLATVLCARATRALATDPSQARAPAAEADEVLSPLRHPSLEARLICLRARARLSEADGDRAGAMALLEQALAAVESTPASSAHLHGLVLDHLGVLYFRENRLDETLALNGRALAVLEASGRANTLSYLKILSNRGAILGAGGEYLAQKEIWERVLAQADALNLQGRVPDGFTARYGVTLLRMSFYEQSHDLLLAAHERALAQGNEEVVAMSNLNLGKVLSALQRFDDAEARLAAAEAVLSRDPHTYRMYLEGAEVARAIIDRRMGRLDTARERVNQVLARLGYPASTTAQSLDGFLGVAARTELLAGDFASAERLATHQLRIAEKTARDPALSANVGAALVLRARARLELGRPQQAQADLQRALGSLRAGLGEDNRETVEARELLREIEGTGFSKAL